jgi:hypothetical protein
VCVLIADITPFYSSEPPADLRSRLGCSSRGSSEPIVPEHAHPHLRALPVVQCRSDVEIKRWDAREGTPPTVVVDDIAHASAAAVDNPIMSVERSRVSACFVSFLQQVLATEKYAPHPSLNPCPRTNIRWPTLEADEPRPPTRLRPASRLPTHNLRPRPLVHGVVDRYDDLHVWCLWIVLLARHRGEELGLGRVHPFRVFKARVGGRTARDGRRLPRGREIRMVIGRLWRSRVMCGWRRRRAGPGWEEGRPRRASRVVDWALSRLSTCLWY